MVRKLVLKGIVRPKKTPAVTKAALKEKALSRKVSQGPAKKRAPRAPADPNAPKIRFRRKPGKLAQKQIREHTKHATVVGTKPIFKMASFRRAVIESVEQLARQCEFTGNDVRISKHAVEDLRAHVEEVLQKMFIVANKASKLAGRSTITRKWLAFAANAELNKHELMSLEKVNGWHLFNAA